MSSLLKWEKSGLKNPLSRARGLGSAKSGVHHWMMQRLTAVSNLILGLWLMYSIVMNADLQYMAGAEGWLSQPVNAIGVILFVISSLYHSLLGVQVVVEDYIHHEGFKIVKLMAVRLVFCAMGVACIFSVLQVAL